MKVGRNEPCPCGSGKKFKRCHGDPTIHNTTPSIERIEMIRAQVMAKEARRVSQQGKGKPIISAEHKGFRFTAVGDRLFYSKAHKTFVDFLNDYLKSTLGHEWGNAEIAKPLAERHPVMQWYDSLCRYQQLGMKKPRGEIQELTETGLTAAYHRLAYNLYLLHHNAELQQFLLKRLRNPKTFYAAYYETYVAAWFILSGFSLRLENEEDPTRTHPEFVATRDGVSYSVEAKSREPGKPHYDVGNQLYAALSIESAHPRIIFIDLNVRIDGNHASIAEAVKGSIQGREPKMTIKGIPAPPAHVFITDLPYHLYPDETALPSFCLATGFKIADFGYGAAFPNYTSAHKARLKYAALNDVQKALAEYKIPSTFDGELPEFSYDGATRRFTVGEDITLGDGRVMTLISGIVVEQEKRAYLVLEHGKEQFIVNVDLTDAEVSAYKAHPETFFGRVERVSKGTTDPLDLYEFFLDGCRETPRETLLNHMAGSPHLEELKKLPDDELRYANAEGLTRSALRMREKKVRRITDQNAGVPRGPPNL